MTPPIVCVGIDIEPAGDMNKVRVWSGNGRDGERWLVDDNAMAAMVMMMLIAIPEQQRAAQTIGAVFGYADCD